MTNQAVKGFSKLSKEQKVQWLLNEYFDNDQNAAIGTRYYCHSKGQLHQLHDELSENTVSTF